MLPVITDLIEWINNLKFAAHRMIIDDAILQSAPPLFQQCADIAIKTDGIHCDGDEGAFSLMTELFSNCLIHQFEQVELLFSEYFPLMNPNWKLHREIWLFRFLMYQRFQQSDVKIRDFVVSWRVGYRRGKY